MPQIYYNTSSVELWSLSQWVTHSPSGKSRKVASDGGETERLKKRTREKQTRRSMKEVERMKKYEEVMKRREKMVRQDKRRSELTKAGNVEPGNHCCKTQRRTKYEKTDKHGRWQLGDGLKEQSEYHKKERKAETEEKHALRKNNTQRRIVSDKCHGKRRQPKQAVKKQLVNSSGKERTNDWVGIIQKEYNSNGRSWVRCNVPHGEPVFEISAQESESSRMQRTNEWVETFQGESKTAEKSWVLFSVPQQVPVFEIYAQADQNYETESNLLEREDSEDLPAPLPISRLSLDDTFCVPVMKSFRDHILIVTSITDVGSNEPVIEPDNITGDLNKTNKRQIGQKKSFKSIITSVFRLLTSCVPGKSE